MILKASGFQLFSSDPFEQIILRNQLIILPGYDPSLFQFQRAWKAFVSGLSQDCSLPESRFIRGHSLPEVVRILCFSEDWCTVNLYFAFSLPRHIWFWTICFLTTFSKIYSTNYEGKGREGKGKAKTEEKREGNWEKRLVFSHPLNVKQQMTAV